MPTLRKVWDPLRKRSRRTWKDQIRTKTIFMRLFLEYAIYLSMADY